MGIWAIAIILLPNMARASLSVIPAVIDIDGFHGAKKQFALKITNSGKEPLDCEVIAQNYSMTKEGLSIGLPDPGPRSATNWLSFTPAKFQLAPEDSQEIKCILTFPGSALGGYYAIAAVRGVPPSRGSTDSGASIQFSFQSNVVVLATAKGTNLKPQPTIRNIELKIGDIDIAKSPMKRPWQVQALVENTGNIHAKIDVNAEIRDSLGSRIWSGQLLAGKGTLIPGFPRYFRSSAIPSLRDGNYVVGTSMNVQGMRIGERGAQAFTVASGIATPSNGEGLVAASIGGIGINPGEVVITGPFRSRRFSSVTIKNQTDKPVSCQLNLGGWKILENGEMHPCDPVEATRSAAGWIQMGSDKLDLVPGASGKIQISATIPEQGAEGEYYAALLVETTTQDDSKIAPSVVMVTVIPDKTSKPSVSSSDLVITPSSTAGYKFSVKAKNDGNIRITPSVDFIVQDSTGKKVGDVVTANPSEQLFPGVVKTIEAESVRALANGKYTLVAVVSAGKDVKAQNLTIPFAIPLPATKVVNDKKPASPGSVSKPATKPKPAVKKPTK